MSHNLMKSNQAQTKHNSRKEQLLKGQINSMNVEMKSLILVNKQIKMKKKRRKKVCHPNKTIRTIKTNNGSNKTLSNFLELSHKLTLATMEIQELAPQYIILI